MRTFVIQRFLLAFPTLILVTILTFAGLRLLLPGDVVDLIVGDNARIDDPAYRSKLEEQLGLDASLPQQYAKWIGITWFWGGETGVLQGNLGASLHNNRSVTSEIIRRVPVSFELGLWAQISAVIVSIPLGVWTALRQDEWPDYVLRSTAILVSSVPSFWIAVLVITYGSLWFNWVPPIKFVYIQDNFIAHMEIILLPAIIIGLTPSGGLLRLTRTQMLEVLREDYIRTAHAKGLSQFTVFYKHALRNALIPIVTVIGLELPNIIAGTVIFEQIFLIPGMGRYLIGAIHEFDYPVIEGLVLVFSMALVFSVVLVDVSYAWLDPRIRFK